jgi:hypothetical protein
MLPKGPKQKVLAIEPSVVWVGILFFPLSRDTKPFSVEWDKQKTGFTNWFPRDDVEVIGNIYENPELLH